MFIPFLGRWNFEILYTRIIYDDVIEYGYYTDVIGYCIYITDQCRHNRNNV